MNQKYKQSHSCSSTWILGGFTIIELVVVIAIIGVISTIGISSYQGVMRSSRDMKRITDAREIKSALEIYYARNGSYPNPGGGWRGECDHPWGTGNLPANSIIPGLIPDYLESFPSDPQMTISMGRSSPCYLYRSDGTDYALLLHNKHALGDRDYLSEQTLLDSYRDGGPDICNVDGTAFWSWKISSPGAKCW